MLAILQLLGVIAAFAALGWAAVKFVKIVSEAADPTVRGQLRTLGRLSICVVVVIIGVLIAFAMLSAMLWGTGCEAVLDPVACTPWN